MKDFSNLFKLDNPVKNVRLCNSQAELKATKAINERMIAVQREFSSKSEMSHSKTVGFHFSC